MESAVVGVSFCIVEESENFVLVICNLYLTGKVRGIDIFDSLEAMRFSSRNNFGNFQQFFHQKFQFEIEIVNSNIFIILKIQSFLR